MQPPTTAPAAEPAALDDAAEHGAFTVWTLGLDGQRTAQSHFALSGLYCAACAGLIERALLAHGGVLSADVNYAARRLSVRWSPALTRPSRIVATVRSAGYDAAPALDEPARDMRRRERRSALWRLFVAALCMMQVMMYAAPAYFSARTAIAPDLLQLMRWASWLLSVPLLLFAAAPILTEAWRGLLRRRIDMSLPVALGIVMTFVVSSGATFDPGGLFGDEVYFDSLAMFVFFLLGGRYLMLAAGHRANAALDSALTRLPPLVRRVDDDGHLANVPLRELRGGDRVRIAHGEAFVADGALLDGRTEVDESLVTGESRPVAKRPGDPLIAGSINIGAPVTASVVRLGAATRYEAIVALMRQALAQRPAVLRTADRIAAPFLGGVLALAAVAAVVWWFIDPSRSVAVAVAVLIVTCPCALSLAAPSALLAACSALARRGVLVQRLDALEALARADCIFFDKTGSVTDGRLRLKRVVVLPAGRAADFDAPGVLALAASLASESTHPLARALAAAAPRTDAVWSDVSERPGCGLQAQAWNGDTVRLGSREWVDGGGSACAAADRAADHLADHPADHAADTAMSYFGNHAGAWARFEFQETLKSDAAASLAALAADGLRVALLSGDAPARVAAVAAQLGIAEVHGAATPEAKLRRLADEQRHGHCVAMVGDGVNDAPVIARADVSFVFAQGAAITQSKADFIGLSGRVDDVVQARAVARRALRVLRQNTAWAVGYNLCCVPLAVFGLFPPWAAGLGMATSSLLVVANAWRIDRHALRP